MASPIRWWTWVWASSGSWWWRWKPGMLQSMGSQRVEHDWATKLNWWRVSELSWQWWMCHLANVLQWRYNEAQVLLEVESSTVLDLVGSNQFLSCPYGFVILLKVVCPVPFPLVSKWCQLQIGACQGHLPSVSKEIESHPPAAVDPQHTLKGVQGGEWDTLCSKETGGADL